MNQAPGNSTRKAALPGRPRLLNLLKRFTVIALIASVIAYMGIITAMFSLQRMLLFPATKDIYRDPSQYGWAFEDVLLNVEGETTHGWFVPVENERGVALFSHGNAGNIADRLESIGLLRSLGLSVLAYDYGGYGKSSGKPTEQRCRADARAMWRFLLESKGYAPGRILLFGRSLGGAVTCDLAVDHVPAAVIIESTFTSIPDMAQRVFPLLPARWLVRDRFDNAAKINGIKSPLLLVHSPEDTVIPFEHGQRLFELAREPKFFLEIHGDHNTGFVESEPIYKKGLGEFLDKYLPAQ